MAYILHMKICTPLVTEQYIMKTKTNCKLVFWLVCGSQPNTQFCLYFYPRLPVVEETPAAPRPVGRRTFPARPHTRTVVRPHRQHLVQPQHNTVNT